MDKPKPIYRPPVEDGDWDEPEQTGHDPHKDQDSD